MSLTEVSLNPQRAISRISSIPVGARGFVPGNRLEIPRDLFGTFGNAAALLR